MKDHERTMARPPRRPGWMRNFAHPRGAVGAAVGWLMARKNRRINELAVATLDPGAADRVLEIGFGPGVAIALLAAAARNGQVHGVDVSAVMVRQAERRNRRQVRSGLVRLRQGGVDELPYPDGSFDGVIATNNFHLWPDPVAGLVEVVRVLRGTGQLVLGLRTAPRRPGRYVPPGFSEEELEGVKQRLVAAGFAKIERIDAAAGGRDVVLMRASP